MGAVPQFRPRLRMISTNSRKQGCPRVSKNVHAKRSAKTGAQPPPYPAVHAYVALEVLHLVVQLPVLLHHAAVPRVDVRQGVQLAAAGGYCW